MPLTLTLKLNWKLKANFQLKTQLMVYLDQGLIEVSFPGGSEVVATF